MFLGFIGFSLLAAVLLHLARSRVSDIYQLPIFEHLFVRFDTIGLIVACGVVVLALFFVEREWNWKIIPRWIAQHAAITASIIFFLLSIGTLTAYHNYPLCMDEWAPFFQAMAFAEGHLSGKYPPAIIDYAVPFGRNFFFAASAISGKVVSHYLPSFALLLSPFVFLKIPWALNPLLASLSILLVKRMCRVLKMENHIAGLAILFFVASPAFTIMSMSYYSMTAHLFFNIGFTYLLLRKRYFVAGIAGSIALTLHNPFPHISYAIPWLIWATISERKHFKAILHLCIGYLPLSLLCGLGWALFKGSIAADQHLIGLQAQPLSTYESMLQSNFGLPTVVVIYYRLIGLSKLALWAVPGLLPLALLGFQRMRHDIIWRLIGISATTSFLAYFAVEVDQGHGWGYRYFHHAFVCLPLLAVAAVYVSKHSDMIGRFLITVILGSIFASTALRAIQVHTFIGDHLAQVPEMALGKTRVIWIRPWEGYYTTDLVHNPPFLNSHTLYLLSPQLESEQTVMRSSFPSYKPLTPNPHERVWVRENDN